MGWKNKHAVARRPDKIAPALAALTCCSTSCRFAVSIFKVAFCYLYFSASARLGYFEDWFA
jgi:hypothetical protein